MRLYECFGIESKTGDLLKCFFYAFFALMNINYDLAILLFAAMTLDMLLGLSKAIVLNEKLSFKIFWTGFLVKLAILIIPFTVAILGIALKMNFEWTADFAIRVLLANECLSILANILSLKNKKKVENIDLITVFLSWIRSNALSVFERFLKTNSNKD